MTVDYYIYRRTNGTYGILEVSPKFQRRLEDVGDTIYNYVRVYGCTIWGKIKYDYK